MSFDILNVKIIFVGNTKIPVRFPAQILGASEAGSEGRRGNTWRI